jgi:aspartate racemase
VAVRGGLRQTAPVKTLGLIGGMSWLSTIGYYRTINERVQARLGGAGSAKLLLYSVNFAEMKPPADAEGWARVAATLTDIARRLETAGAECLVLCANTPHKVAGEVQGGIGIPLLHIADATADAIVASGVDCVGLLGTRPSMEEPFLTSRLAARGISTLVPDEASRAFVHASIFEELGMGVLSPETKARYLAILDDLVARGARGVILGCTEIPLLIAPADCAVPLYDTAALHAAAAVEFALS